MQSKIQNPKSKIASGQHRGRLVRHYFLISAILIGGGLITSGLVEIYFRYHENHDHLVRLEQEIAKGAAFKIEGFIKGIRLMVESATKNPGIANKGLSEDYTFELKRLLSSVPAITEVLAFDLAGNLRADASRLPVSSFRDKVNISKREALRQAKRGQPYFSRVYFFRGSEPYITIAVPIKQFPGKIIGALLAEVNLKYVGEVISSIKVGKAGHAYVVTRSGDLIAHPDISLVLQHSNLRHLGQVKAAFGTVPGGVSQQATVSYDLAGEKVLSSYASIPTLNWAVMVERPEKEAYELIYASVMRTSSLLLVGFGMALLASLLLARRVIRPLNVLREGAEHLGRGDLGARLELKTGDEFEIVAEEFNKMTDSLRELYTDLEHKVAERTQELTIANEKLEVASSHKSQFLANVNHELRTPVSAIISSARLILRKTEGQNSSVQKDLLQDLLSTAERLLDLVDGLLDLAKIEAGRMELHMESVRIDELIQGTLSTVEPILKPGRVRLLREVTSGIPTLNTDRDKLRQIILNLVSNAAKFTEEGEIKVSALQQNGSLRLVVSDTGIGIGKGELNHIFEEFRQGDMSRSRKYGGTGLGLTIVKKLVDLLGGEIGVESEVGKGSTFTVTLPLGHSENA